MRIDEHIEEDTKRLKEYEPDSPQAEIWEGSLRANREGARERMDDITLYGPIAVGLLALGAVLVSVGGRQKKS
jgi:hypothetical protein